MAKVVILGGSGFIGTHLNLWFQKTNHIVKSIDVNRSKLVGLLGNHTAVEIVDGLRQHHLDGADYVIWAAGLTSHTEGQQIPLAYNRNNVEGVVSLIGLMRGMKRKPTLIYLSTTSLYGHQDGLIDESTPPNPIDVYSATKLMAEHYIDVFRKQGEIEACILRLPNCYGPHGRPEAKYGVVNHWLSLAERGEPLLVYGDGEQKRCFLYIEDVIRAIATLLFNAPLEAFLPEATFNILPFNNYSIREVAVAIAQAYKTRVEHIEWPDERKGIEIGDHVFYGAPRKFNQLTGWHPLYDLKQGIQETYENFDNRRAGTHRQRFNKAPQPA